MHLEESIHKARRKFNVPAISGLLARGIGVRVKRFMSKRIQYSDEPLGEFQVVPNFSAVTGTTGAEERANQDNAFLEYRQRGFLQSRRQKAPHAVSEDDSATPG